MGNVIRAGNKMNPARQASIGIHISASDPRAADTRTERADSSLALAEREPLTLANPKRRGRLRSRLGFVLACRSRVSHFDEIFLHVPGAGRAALGGSCVAGPGRGDFDRCGHSPEAR
jgi:hypothetical protein